MENSSYSSAFFENEKEANRYTAKCMRVMEAIVVIVWILNIVGIFIVPSAIMTVAAIGGTVFFMLPTLLLKFFPNDSPKMKFIIMSCFILGLTMLSAAMPKHTVIAWSAPVVVSCHYYSRRYSYLTLAISVLLMSTSIIMGACWGEWDFNLLEDLANNDGVRTITPQLIKGVVIFYVIPRDMILVGIASTCIALANRTHRLLETQVQNQMEKQRIESELDVATHIQTSMLPCVFPAFPEREEFDIYASMTPAREVGGDFYDFFMVDDTHLAIVMADVSGKGVPAALFMVIGKTLLKDHTGPQDDLGEVFTKVNNLLCESNSEGLFITAFEGVLDLATGEFRYVNAGHEMPFICRAGGDFIAEKIKPGFVLAGMEEMKYRAGSVVLNEGDRLFQYTDGVTEATNADNELFGMERLSESLNAAKDKSIKEIIESVKADIDSFAGNVPQFDDITMLCLSYNKKLD